MQKYISLLLLCLITCLPAQAFKPRKLPKVTRIVPETNVKLSTSVLTHVQPLREIQPVKATTLQQAKLEELDRAIYALQVKSLQMQQQTTVVSAPRKAVKVYTAPLLSEETMNQTLRNLETFVKEYQHFPAASMDDREHNLYLDVCKMLNQLSPRDPIALRVRTLQRTYR